MTLQDIEEIVLNLVGYDKYSDLSADASKTTEFALLHKCVFFARDRIRLGTTMPALLKFATTITSSTTQTEHTITDTDFDIPSIVLFTDSDGNESKLKKIVPTDIETLADLTTIDKPVYYSMLGSTSEGLSKILIFPISKVSGLIDIIYKPVISNITTSTGQDVIMLKYPFTVVNLATAYAFQILKKDMANFEKWLALGDSDFKNITLRETATDWNESIKIESLLATKRSQRTTI